MRKKIKFAGLFAALFAAAFLIAPPEISKSSAASQQKQEQSQTRAAEDSADGKFALLVGIDKYQHVPRLHGAVKDVEMMAARLESGKFGFAAANVKLLRDEEGTAENIIGSFRSQLIDKAADYKKRTGKQATVFFQFSGHGSQVPTGGKKADEPDNMDETIVPVNSRDEEKKYFDIIDDDIAVLVKELSKSTTNAVYVFDSCHSGTVNRGDGVAREVDADERKMKQPASQIPASFGYGAATARDVDAGGKDDLFVGSDKYVMISGSRSDERSYEKVEGGVSHGALSFYLELALRNVGTDTTYRELMNRVADQVSHDNRAQHPQVSGNVNATLFGGEVKDADVPINVIASDDATVTIDAGKMSGVKVGSLVAFYDKSKARLVGSAGKIGEGEVIETDLKTSVVAFSPAAGKTVAKADKESAKAVLLSPLFGAESLPVMLETDGLNAPAKTANRDITEKLKQRITNGAANAKASLFKLVVRPAGASKDVSENGAVSIRRGKFRDAFCGGLPKTATNEDCLALLPEAPLASDRKTRLKLPADDEQIYYLVPSVGGNQPIFDFYESEADYAKETDKDAASAKISDKIFDALTKYARQKNLEALDNNGSALADFVKIEMLVITGERTPDNFVIKASEVANLKTGESRFHFKPGTYFRFRITNASKSDLYFTALDISTDGAINAIYPIVAQEAVASGVTVETKIQVFTRPFGEEQFKFIATKEESDYSLFSQGKASRDGLRGAENPLTMLMQQATEGFSNRAGDVDVAPQTDDWAVLKTVVVVEK